MLVTAAIIASDLVLSYGSTTAVDRSSFEIPRGALTAVIGPNGSGAVTCRLLTLLNRSLERIIYLTFHFPGRF